MAPLVSPIVTACFDHVEMSLRKNKHTPFDHSPLLSSRIACKTQRSVHFTSPYHILPAGIVHAGDGKTSQIHAIRVQNTPPPSLVSTQQTGSGASAYESDFSDDERTVQKPEGEARRPGRGGYNLERELKWSKKDFTQVKVGLEAFSETIYSLNLFQEFVRLKVLSGMDVKVLFLDQPLVKIKEIQHNMCSSIVRVVVKILTTSTAVSW